MWALGPKGVGPNMLLCPPLSGGLFDVAPGLVVRTGRHAGEGNGEAAVQWETLPNLGR